MVNVTQLRYACSKDPQKLVDYTNKFLSYKIEIKGNPVYVKGKWYLWFNLPDKPLNDLPYGDLDK